jgi:CRISPR-associated protein Csb2
VPTLEIRFPGHRYHATPWGHHVNEGLIEWPPSPWRVLRALLATGYAKLHWPASGPPENARSLIEKLAAALPRYGLPRAGAAHTRHYMSLATLDKGREKTTMVFDTWAQVEEALLIRWDAAALVEGEMALLRNLADNLGYLGRSESWTNVRLCSEDESLDPFSWADPYEKIPHPGRGWEQVPLLAPMSGSDYAVWRDAAVRESIEKLSGLDPSKKPTAAQRKKIASVEGYYPSDLVACLQVETSWLQKTGWSQPPGTRRVFYWRRVDALEVTPRPRRRRVEPPPVTAVLLAIGAESSNDHALPSMRRTLPQAEQLHRAFVARLMRIGRFSETLVGRDATGVPLSSGHQHAHVIPLDLDGDGHLEHVVVWAPRGMNSDALRAIREVRQTFMKGGSASLRLALAAEGSLSQISNLPPPFGERLRALVEPARKWRSVTPFVPPRHMKARGRNTLLGQIEEECKGRGLAAPSSIKILNLRDPVFMGIRHFVRSRRFGQQPPVDIGFSVEFSGVCRS